MVNCLAGRYFSTTIGEYWRTGNLTFAFNTGIRGIKALTDMLDCETTSNSATKEATSYLRDQPHEICVKLVET